MFLYRQKNKHKRIHVKRTVTQNINRTNQMTKIDEDNGSCERKVIPPKSQMNVNQGEKVNASEL